MDGGNEVVVPFPEKKMDKITQELTEHGPYDTIDDEVLLLPFFGGFEIWNFENKIFIKGDEFNTPI